jgi:flavin reductase (DIM6/NTAB) family NADH-FMN oxidoreductase RutF
VRDFHELKVADPVSGEMKVTGTMVIAEVVLVHANKAVYNEKDGAIDINKLRPMSRLGGGYLDANTRSMLAMLNSHVA